MRRFYTHIRSTNVIPLFQTKRELSYRYETLLDFVLETLYATVLKICLDLAI